MAVKTVQLFILGVLSLGEAHGYQFISRARTWQVEDWAGIGTGSIYNGLGTLQKQGLIEEARVERTGAHGTRTVYAITEAGREALFTMLRETAQTIVFQDPFQLALGFFGVLSTQEREELIGRRIEAVRREGERTQAQLDELIAEHGADNPHTEWARSVMSTGVRLSAFYAGELEAIKPRVASWTLPAPSAVFGDGTGDHDG
jgi:DNA-binding PadR family transcriptional regulator